LVIVQPATVLRWRRQGLWAILASGSRGRWRGGRPRISSEIRTLILRMSHENFLWGAPRIHGELLKLGFDVSQASVSRYMPRRPFRPTQRWGTFLRNQALGMGAMGIFQVGWISDQALAFIRCWRSRLLKAVFLLGTTSCSPIKCSSLTSLLGSGVRRRYRAPPVMFDPRGRRVTPYRSRASPTARPSAVVPAAVRNSRAGHSLRAAHQLTGTYATYSNSAPSWQMIIDQRVIFGPTHGIKF
jgi:hypothetical protein